MVETTDSESIFSLKLSVDSVMPCAGSLLDNATNEKWLSPSNGLLFSPRISPALISRQFFVVEMISLDLVSCGCLSCCVESVTQSDASTASYGYEAENQIPAKISGTSGFQISMRPNGNTLLDCSLSLRSSFTSYTWLQAVVILEVTRSWKWPAEMNARQGFGFHEQEYCPGMQQNASVGTRVIGN